jgi:hypothetical protein
LLYYGGVRAPVADEDVTVVVRLRHGGLSPSAVRNVQVFDGQGIRLQLAGVTDGFHG